MTTTERLYISGPMTGYPAYNFPAFFDAEKVVRSALTPAEVFNPARRDRDRFCPGVTPTQAGQWLLDHPNAFDLRVALALDLTWIAREATGIVLLPGWEKSKGARAEHALAEALGLDKYLYDPVLADIREAEWKDSCGNEHAYALTGQRQQFQRPDVEVRTTSSTGGQKGVKPEQYQSIPAGALRELAEHYTKGGAKYGDHNFRKGFEWSKSYSALLRHLLAFWGGEDLDAETGSKHVTAVAWHALCLSTFMDEHPEFDDRYKRADK